MPDLFLSYTSDDRPSAERMREDLLLRFPTIKIFWDKDQESLPLGAPYRPALIAALENSTHFAVLWSQKAEKSNEVGPEVQAFAQHQRVHPELNDAKRALMPV